ncbi:MAG: hypothetical protein GY842_01600 [bacterium]|nr:hypothetical protein [bacterium]
MGVGSTVYDRAQEAAANLLGSFSKSDRVSVVTLADPAGVTADDPAFDRRGLGDAVAGIGLTERSASLVAGLERAAAILEQSSAAPGNRTVYVISDFAGLPVDGFDPVAVGGRSVDEAEGIRRAAQAVADVAELVLISVGEPAATNLGVVGLELGSTVLAPQVPVLFTAEVANYGAADVRGAELRVQVTGSDTPESGRVEQRVVLPTLEPGQVEAVPFSLVFDGPGPQVVRVGVHADSPDDLKLDDERALAVEVSEGVAVLVVDGGPGRTRLSGEAGHLLAALNPWDDGERAGMVSTKAISDLDLPGEVLRGYRVVILCNVERLDAATWRHLGAYVENGGGLLVFSGDALAVDHYNELGYAEGAGVLPGRLMPAEGELEDGESRSPSRVGGQAELADSVGVLRLVGTDPVHPVVAELESLPTSGVFGARVRRRTRLELEAGSAEVVLNYSDGPAAIAVVRKGRGRCGVVTTSADMSWSNLPAKGDYVSLMMNLVNYLAQTPAHEWNVEVGQPIVRRLSAAEAELPLRVRLPGGAVVDTPPSAGASGFELRYAATERKGLYSTVVGNSERPVAVVPPRSESSVAGAGQAALAALVDTEHRHIGDLAELSAQAARSTGREVGEGLMYAVLALLLAETWLAMRQGAVARRGRAEDGVVVPGALSPSSAESAVRKTA